MAHFEFYVKGKLTNEAISGLLWQWPFESLLELKNGVKAYISEKDFTKDMRMEIFQMADDFSLEISETLIPDQNWNQKWENSFEPVLVDDFCYVKADFHGDIQDVKYSITINPKMAFGTAHHETTFMMIEMMKDLNFKDKYIFDYGTGTGILAILAEQMGAKGILALDYDSNSTENATENILLNNAKAIEVQLGEISVLDSDKFFDIILANINIIVLKNQPENLAAHLNKNGKLLLSGILVSQKNEIIRLYEQADFILESFKSMGDWACMLFTH